MPPVANRRIVQTQPASIRHAARATDAIVAATKAAVIRSQRLTQKSNVVINLVSDRAIKTIPTPMTAGRSTTTPKVSGSTIIPVPTSGYDSLLTLRPIHDTVLIGRLGLPLVSLASPGTARVSRARFQHSVP